MGQAFKFQENGRTNVTHKTRWVRGNKLKVSPCIESTVEKKSGKPTIGEGGGRSEEHPARNNGRKPKKTVNGKAQLLKENRGKKASIPIPLGGVTLPGGTLPSAISSWGG